MKIALASILTISALALPAVAHADDYDYAGRRSYLGADFELLPTGSLTQNFAGGGDTTSDTATAYAIGAYYEEQLDPWLAVGIAPRYIFNVNTSDSNGDSATELDLRARVAVGHHLAPRLRVYGFAEPGYSIIFPPDSVEINGNKVHPNGFVIGVGGGVSYHLAPALRVYFELGYQWGFQSWSTSGTIAGQTVTVTGDDKLNYLQLGFGLQFAID